MDGKSHPRVVLVHDWLTGMRGGEKCLESLCRQFPDATLHTLIHRKGSVSPAIEHLRPRTSFLQWLPGVHRYYRWLLPILPFAVPRKLPHCDLVVSLSHAVAKAALPPRGVPHLCYCFTPMRYAWHLRESYFARGRLGRIKSRLADLILARIRAWDQRASSRVTHFVAISKTVQQRIRECYDRDSTVIYPPVETDYYTPAAIPREDFFLIVSAFAPYKRIDLAIEACRKLRRKLVVIGSGQDESRLQHHHGEDVFFLGHQPDEVIRHYYRRCRALLFPGEEDFGIVPVEANACGAPVIAFGRGGLTETQVGLGHGGHPTAVFFEEQTVDAMIEAIQRFDSSAEAFDPIAIRKQATKFNRKRYETELFGQIDALIHGQPTPAVRVAA